MCAINVKLRQVNLSQTHTKESGSTFYIYKLCACVTGIYMHTYKLCISDSLVYTSTHALLIFTQNELLEYPIVAVFVIQTQTGFEEEHGMFPMRLLSLIHVS